ncbi:MAG: leucyl aminopeptidase [Actinobacteria bacterium]|nr:leucyl aminopeptidase [Thermoleophilia bacterium]MCB9010590.1 leucyl aminopeptidase [Actinomycetota bacterium]
MQLTVSQTDDPTVLDVDLVVVTIGSGKRITGPLAALDAALGGSVQAAVADREITGSAGGVTIVHGGGRIAAGRVAVVGIGDASAEHLRKAGRALGTRARGLGVATVALFLPSRGVQPEPFLTALAHGAYRFTRFRSSDDESTAPIAEVTLHGRSLSAGALARTAGVIEATARARDLGNTPSNLLTPSLLAEYARDLAGRYDRLECDVLGPTELSALGAGALLGVGQGSVEPPRMIVLRYSPPRPSPNGEVLGLVGKAVTFDTGGISIKPASGMEEMKLDMAGGAAVIEAMGLIAEVAPGVDVVGVIPTAENMPDGNAIKPGDVLRAMDGTTIEVTNTDAEGRLILADALCYATRHAGATHLVDLATLTGAILVALGEGHYAGLFSSDDALAKVVREAGDASGQPCWPMPIHEDYRSLFTSKVADVANSSSKRWAGAITAAMFLHRFTDGRPWVHLDVAGTAMVSGAGTGFGVELLLGAAESVAGGALG